MLPRYGTRTLCLCLFAHCAHIFLLAYAFFAKFFVLPFWGGAGALPGARLCGKLSLARMQ